MKRLSVIILFVAAVVLGACTTERQYNKKMREAHPGDPRYEFDIPHIDR